MTTEKECRICLEKDKIDEFINPCLCTGTSKWVHSSCLDKWRQININSKPYHQCMECNYKYKFTTNIVLETYKIKVERKIKVISSISIYIASFVFGYIFYLLDYLNHLNSLKILTFNNTELIERSEFLMKDGYCFLIFYNTLTLSIYFNIQAILCFLYILPKIHRKRLYLSLMLQRYIYNTLCYNNIYYFYSFFGMSGALEMYYILSPFIQFYLFRIKYAFFDKHNKVLHLMNTKYNNQKILNYEKEQEDQCVEENLEITLLDEDLELSLLGEEKTNNQNFDTIEME